MFREKSQRRNVFNFQSTVLLSEYDHLKTPPEPVHRFEVELGPDTFSAEKYVLFEQYQRLVHKEPPSKISESGFRGFLCDSPIKATTRSINGKLQLLGTFHHCYRLDGKLVAMAVLDLLPHGVSAVYFIYDQNVEQWSFGKISAMKEVALADEHGYEYYYMGYYIHSCAKMRYKAEFKPQYLLDPESHDWNILDDECFKMLDSHKYLSLSRHLSQHAQDSKDSRPDNVRLAERPQFEAPESAAAPNRSLFELKIPGVMTVEQLENCVNLDNVLASIDKAQKKQFAPMNVSTAIVPGQSQDLGQQIWLIVTCMNADSQ